MAKKGNGIYLVYSDVDPVQEEEFNAWYNTEHIPELLEVPGVLDAARYEAVKGGPKYLAAYELENIDSSSRPSSEERPTEPPGAAADCLWSADQPREPGRADLPRRRRRTPTAASRPRSRSAGCRCPIVSTRVEHLVQRRVRPRLSQGPE